MSYVLIEFDDGGGVAVVRKTWITPRKREVFWPPMKDPKTFNKVLENTLYPDTEKWKLYSIVRCLYETDDLQKAQQKCKLSEVTSDLQTDNQEVEISKRKITVPRRFISSDEEENDNIYIRPPKLKRKFFNTNKNPRKNILISEQNSSDIDSPKTPDSVPDTDSAEVIEQTARNISKLNSYDTITSRSVPDYVDKNSKFYTYKISHTTPTDDSLTESIVFQEKVIHLLTHIQTQNSQILALLRN